MPVDDGTGCVGDGEGVAGVVESCLSVDDLTTEGIGLCTEDEATGDRKYDGLESPANSICCIKSCVDRAYRTNEAGRRTFAFGLGDLRHRDPSA